MFDVMMPSASSVSLPPSVSWVLYNTGRHDAVLGWLTGRWPLGSQPSHGRGPDALRLGVSRIRKVRMGVWCILALRGGTKNDVLFQGAAGLGVAHHG
jgi:hypothetical protein